MQGVNLRAARRSDIEAVCRIWERCFGDRPDTVKKLLEPETLENTTLAETDRQVRALMTAFDGLAFGAVTGSYILALCTEPDFRGRGLGRLVLRETARRCFERGARFVCLHPASESLARWYAGLGFETLSRVLREPAGAAGAAGTELRRVSAEEYAAGRSGAAPDVPVGLLKAQELFYPGAEGGFFAFDGGILCVQRTEKGAEIRELICPERLKNAAAAAVAERFGAAALLPRVLPACSGQGSTHIMALWRGGARLTTEPPPYLPFVLD